ncbi:hypothetical protein DM02DRAFT_669069 [Periconia macrospinosa]|uniref:Uncharacterized protein n=1 Tax=Periconia macrospinosa TaxID=97972 RepID=A0A2V1E1P9_9PLEO|nr:hypothetical protein DM02DRAFT_669069 [Periconia macrospinosa]
MEFLTNSASSVIGMSPEQAADPTPIKGSIAAVACQAARVLFPSTAQHSTETPKAAQSLVQSASSSVQHLQGSSLTFNSSQSRMELSAGCAPSNKVSTVRPGSSCEASTKADLLPSWMTHGHGAPAGGLVQRAQRFRDKLPRIRLLRESCIEGRLVAYVQ